MIILIIMPLVPLLVTTFVGSAPAQSPAAGARTKAQAKAKAPPAWYKAPGVKNPLDERDPDTWPEFHVSHPDYYNRVYGHGPQPAPGPWLVAYKALLRIKPIPPEWIEHYATIDAETGANFYRHPDGG
jgi:hypothetical protein